ncbi:MAG: hypothetical protein HC901_03065 [Bdellovibrionaceae bacterium]|nr:hypothetical protein [Pseudobdellovibrionaceae bacterium]
MLGDLTPQEAAARPELRVRLERWAKGWIHNDERRVGSKELAEEHDRMLEKLGLGHLQAGPQPPTDAGGEGARKRTKRAAARRQTSAGDRGG